MSEGIDLMSEFVFVVELVDLCCVLNEVLFIVWQVIVIGVCVLFNVFDGFDVLLISFVLLGIVREWGIDCVVLGVVLLMELIGMVVGLVLFGQVVDCIGCWFMVIGCFCVMIVGMLVMMLVSDIVFFVVI